MGAASDALSTQCLSRPGACAHCRALPCCRWGTGPRFVARTWTTKIHIWLPQILEQRQSSLSRPVKLMTPSRAARFSAVWCHASVDDRPGGEAAPEWQRARGETDVSGPRALGQSSGNRVRPSLRAARARPDRREAIARELCGSLQRVAARSRGRGPHGLHRAGLALGERLHPELQCATARRASQWGDLLYAERSPGPHRSLAASLQHL